MSPDDAISLRDWMTEKFSVLERQLTILTNSIVGKDKFEMWCNRVTILETESEEREKRLSKAERVLWLMQILVGLMVPIITAVVISLMIALVTGKMEISFK